MKKFIIAALIVLAFVGIAKWDANRKEAVLKALERQTLVEQVQELGAPLAWTCKTFKMSFAVNDDGEPVCSGVARWNDEEIVAENVAAWHLAQSCEAAGGVAKLATVQAGASALVVRCTQTRFGERWQASK